MFCYNIIDSLIPQAARLILAQTPKNRSDLIHNDRKESEDIFDNFLEDVEPRTPSPDYERESGDISNDFRDEFDYGNGKPLLADIICKDKYLMWC